MNQYISSIFAFTLIFLLSLKSFGQILVFEFDLPGEEIPHIDLVSHVACANPDLICDHHYADGFNVEVLNTFRNSINEAKVVNMSFAYEAPNLNASPSVGTGFDYDQQLKDFEELKNSMFNIIKDFDDVLFSVAAGNGKGARGPQTPGVPLGYQNKLYPAVYDLENILVVSAIETDKIEIDKLDEYKIADWANYSLFEVDIATNVAHWTDGKLLKGTSFSAPYAAKVAATIRREHPNLTALNVKEILMKSSYVQEIDEAIKISKEWNEKGEESLAYKIHSAYVKKVRDDLIRGLGGVMLVKSGGPLVEDVAYQCASNFRRASGLLSISQACLQAHEDRLSSSKERQEKLKELWSLRGI